MKTIVIVGLALVFLVFLMVGLALVIGSWFLGEPFMRLVRKVHGQEEDPPPPAH